ncbi:hypothetical protein IE4872_PC00262 (plasmid) [Rhizobium gallicum]|uniref:Uncharacterized protein n=1 Tax=Rhizobium gallicum TaxID=56730 RepID=A0A1L5NR18_9HYPH|nr:hypothetical protein IE4872_PC00262 [Rhizobium gallicum]
MFLRRAVGQGLANAGIALKVFATVAFAIMALFVRAASDDRNVGLSALQHLHLPEIDRGDDRGGHRSGLTKYCLVKDVGG